MYFDKRMIYIIIGIMAISIGVNYMNNLNGLVSLLITIPGVLIAITFHEFAHAYVADKLGDDTPRNQGRLSLNPLAHLDPIGSLLLLVAGFGWGKPVQVNPRNYNSRLSMEKADALVSLAGPVMNFVIAIISTLIYCAIYKFAGTSFIASTVGTVIMNLIFSAILINIGLGVFNLIPLPPLDGSKIIMPLLSYNSKRWFVEKEQIFYFIFIGIWITGIAGKIISPIISVITNGILKLGLMIFGL